MPHMKMCELAHARWLEIFKGGLFKLVKMPELLYATYLKAQDSPGEGSLWLERDQRQREERRKEPCCTGGK